MKGSNVAVYAFIHFADCDLNFYTLKADTANESSFR